MTADYKLAINILTGKLTRKARRWKALLIVSIISLLILPYPLNKLFGDSIWWFLIFGFIAASFLLSVAVFKHMNKYETKGKLIFQKNGLTQLIH